MRIYLYSKYTSYTGQIFKRTSPYRAWLRLNALKVLACLHNVLDAQIDKIPSSRAPVGAKNH